MFINHHQMSPHDSKHGATDTIPVSYNLTGLSSIEICHLIGTGTPIMGIPRLINWHIYMEASYRECAHLYINTTYPGPWFNGNMYNQYKTSHCKDKAVVRWPYLHKGISYTGKKTLCCIEMGLGILNIDGLVHERHNSSALAMKLHLSCINSLWPSDTIWRQRSGSTLAQGADCCLTASSHYLNQCWLIISEVQWHSHKSNFTRNSSTINH